MAVVDAAVYGAKVPRAMSLAGSICQSSLQGRRQCCLPPPPHWLAAIGMGVGAAATLVGWARARRALREFRFLREGAVAIVTGMVVRAMATRAGEITDRSGRDRREHACVQSRCGA